MGHLSSATAGDGHLPDGLVNAGVGTELETREVATLMQRVVGHEGEVVYDAEKPDGTPQKLLDVSRLHALGWEPRIGLEEGIRMTYQWYLEHVRARGPTN